MQMRFDVIDKIICLPMYRCTLKTWSLGCAQHIEWPNKLPNTPATPSYSRHMRNRAICTAREAGLPVSRFSSLSQLVVALFLISFSAKWSQIESV